MSGYVDTYIQRDIQDLVRIRHPQNFRRLMEALAKATGWESVQEELSRDCGETRSNVSRHMSLLKDTNLLYELKGYALKGERVYKQAKYFWFDSGMACFLSGIHGINGLKDLRPSRGRYVEHFASSTDIILGLLADVHAGNLLFETQGWNTRGVDFVVRSDNRVIGVEVKVVSIS